MSRGSRFLVAIGMMTPLGLHRSLLEVFTLGRNMIRDMLVGSRLLVTFGMLTPLGLHRSLLEVLMLGRSMHRRILCFIFRIFRCHVVRKTFRSANVLRSSCLTRGTHVLQVRGHIFMSWI